MSLVHVYLNVDSTVAHCSLSSLINADLSYSGSADIEHLCMLNVCFNNSVS
jgi:hypothetical protein